MYYLVETTEKLKNNTHGLNALSANDTIGTAGYYALNDGGAGVFTVRAKAAGETADDMFTYAVGENLIAELQIPNGVVNVDQIGAKGNGWVSDAIYMNEPMKIISTESTDVTATSIGAQQYTDARNTNDENWECLSALAERDDIREICFTAGKVYPINGIEFLERTDLTINGNGAILTDDSMNVFSSIFLFTDSSNITVKNIQFTRLLHNVPEAIHAQGCERMLFENIRFVFGDGGIVAEDCNCMHFQNIHCRAIRWFLIAQRMQNSSIDDVTFSLPIFGDNSLDAVLSLQDSTYTVVHNVNVQDAEKALNLSGLRNVTFTDCSFAGIEGSCYEDNSKYVQVASAPMVEIEPAQNDFVQFNFCTFERPDYPQSILGNEQMIAVIGDTGTDGLYVLDGCRFCNRGTQTNSPIRIDTENNEYIKMLVKNCMLEGFRWTMRISGETETAANVSDEASTTVIINPAFSAWPTETYKALAIARFNQIGNFAAADNLYFLTNATEAPYYKAGENYGVSE